MTPRQVIEALHNLGIFNDIQIFQDIHLAHEGVHCEIYGHTLDWNPTDGFVIDAKE